MWVSCVCLVVCLCVCVCSVNLARALYSGADLLLLDDVLSGTHTTSQPPSCSEIGQLSSHIKSHPGRYDRKMRSSKVVYVNDVMASRGCACGGAPVPSRYPRLRTTHHQV